MRTIFWVAMIGLVGMLIALWGTDRPLPIVVFALLAVPVVVAFVIAVWADSKGWHFLRSFAIALIGLIGLLALIPLIEYGTARPCEILKYDIQRSLMRKMVGEMSTNTWEQAGQLAGIAIAGTVVDRLTGMANTMQCLQALTRIHIKGEDFPMTKATQSMAQAVRSAESPVTPSHTMREILLQGNTASVGPSREDPTISPSTWTYHESQDDMGRGTIKTARMESVNRITFGFPYEGIQRARLTLRQHPAYGKDVMLSIDRGQFLCQIGGCQVLVRFDEAKPQPHSAVAPEDHRTTMLFIQGYETIVTKIARAKTLRIEAQFYQEGPRVFEFQVAGLTWAASAKQTTKRPK